MDVYGRDRSKKRRKVAEANESTPSGSVLPPQQLILEEVDVELGLRERLYETARSRLTWALLLQDALQNGSSSRNGDLQDAALDALRAAEEPSKPLFDREPFLLGRPVTSLTDGTPVPLDTAAPQQATSRIAARVRGLPRAPPQPVRKLLFLRDVNTDPPEVAKLACLDCSRSDFSNLQGLLNHCRIRHGREFGSHDECIQSCAVIVPEEERDWVVANGTLLAGISLPSLRRLFEIAVGAGDDVRIPSVRRKPEPAQPADQGTDVGRAEIMAQANIELTKTLGLHKDTPALAPFLGREPKKRIINAADDPDEIVDIVGERSLTTRNIWQKPHIHRNVARPDLDEVFSDAAGIIPVPTEGQHAHEPVANGTLPVVGVGLSRFHIVARVRIVDFSLWLPPERRLESKSDHPYRWRLSVSSPSYSLHISTFLEKVTVTCLSDPPPSTLVDPIVVTEPPFVVTNTTDKPFLARLTFTWTGSANAPTDVEHWVDADPVQSGHAVLGDEQVFDVELDRNTQLLPFRADVRKVAWKDDDTCNGDHDRLANERIEGRASDVDRGFSAVLRSLLHEVPITTRDAKTRRQTAPPFVLVPGPAQYRNLVPGRRKAIEMSRARALHKAYQEFIALSDEQDHTILTVADVYHWLESQRLFPRDQNQLDGNGDGGRPKKMVDAQNFPEAYCQLCGLHRSQHPIGVKMEEETSGISQTRSRPASFQAVCTQFNAAPSCIPLFSANRLLRRITVGSSEPRPYGLSDKLWTATDRHPKPGRSPSSMELVAIAHPGLIIAIRGIAEKWRLAHLRAPVIMDSPEGPLAARTQLTKPRQELLDDLGPYAMLAVVTMSMVRLLVRSGLEALRRDETAQRGLRRAERAKGRQTKTETLGIRRLLTPSHILRGLSVVAGQRLTESAVLVSLASLGMEADEVVTGSAAHDEVGVKEEQA